MFKEHFENKKEVLESVRVNEEDEEKRKRSMDTNDDEKEENCC